jgi:hypothetical protein
MEIALGTNWIWDGVGPRTGVVTANNRIILHPGNRTRIVALPTGVMECGMFLERPFCVIAQKLWPYECDPQLDTHSLSCGLSNPLQQLRHPSLHPLYHFQFFSFV